MSRDCLCRRDGTLKGDGTRRDRQGNCLDPGKPSSKGGALKVQMMTMAKPNLALQCSEEAHRKQIFGAVDLFILFISSSHPEFNHGPQSQRTDGTHINDMI